MMRPRNKKSSNIDIVVEAGGFFKEKVSQAVQKNKLKIKEDIEFYLVNLLQQMMFSANLFTTDPSGNSREEVLAFLLEKALQSDNADFREASLRRLGDISLYTAGFFPDRLSQKVVDVDYYIGMGKGAYSSLASTISVAEGRRRIFGELGNRFHRYVEVLHEVSELTGSKDSRNILRTYELWLKTKSERAEKTLKEAGIIPNMLQKPDREH